MKEEIVATLKRLLIDQLFVEIPEEKIGLDDGLQSVVGLDSVGFVELRLLCERYFNVQISDDDYTPDNFNSVRHVAELIERLQAAQKK
jgi:acyl carrier protein